MSESEITAVVQPDIRNPNDKLIFDLHFLPNDSRSSVVSVSVDAASQEIIKTRFGILAVSGLVSCLFRGNESDVIHRLTRFWRSKQTLARFDLLARNKVWVETRQQTSSVTKRPVLVYQPALLFATLGLEDTKVVDVIPRTTSKQGAFYEVLFDAS